MIFRSGNTVQYDFSELMQSLFKWGNIENSRFTLDKELNICLYGMAFCGLTCRSYKSLKWLSLWPTLWFR